MQYADIIIDIASEALDRTFQYSIPERLLNVIVLGSVVMIPFGKGATLKKGYVIGFSDKPAIEEYKIKEIAEVVSDAGLVESNLVALAAWISQEYGSTMAAALRVVFPVRKQIKPKENTFLHLDGDESLWQERLEFFEKKHQSARYRLLEALVQDRLLPREIVTAKLGVSKAVIDALIEQGICHETKERVYRGNAPERSTSVRCVTLNDEQSYIVEDISRRLEKDDIRPSLIHGVTGSGKTEVYIELAARIVAMGKQAIVLIPEIALTYQTVMRFYRRFGNRVTSLHSKMTPAERYDQFQRARNGELDVVIGPRSALFCPFDRLGAIIIDEEHEGSYKSEQTPKYHARETAIERARLSGAMVVMGSATPSVESYYKAKTDIYELYEMKNRTAGGILPTVEVVDLRQELVSGNKSPFSRRLSEKIQDRLEKGEQSILFLNRRGYAGFISCRACGHVFKCPHCDVTLSGHRNGTLVCHYCGYTERYIKQCPECGSKYVGVMKAGTEAIEKACSMAFPTARILRMDMDTTKGKDGHEKILEAFAHNEADILVGTQMIVKGHDFPNVTLVGILAADMSLYASDYMAGERTFQLLVQAAGRAGRASKAGEVIIQTYNPEEPHIVAAAAQDYESFYEQEIAYRGLMDYPPVGGIIACLVEGLTEAEVMGVAKRLAAAVFAKKDMCVSVIGPAPASIAYIKDVHRAVIYLKAQDHKNLIAARGHIEACFEKLRSDISKNCNIQFDLNPMRGY